MEPFSTPGEQVERGVHDVTTLAATALGIRRGWVAGELLRGQQVPEGRLILLCNELLQKAIAAAIANTYGTYARDVLLRVGMPEAGTPDSAAIFVASTFQDAYPNIYLRYAMASLMRLYRQALRETLGSEEAIYDAFDRHLAVEIEGIVELLVARVERQYYDIKGSVVEILLKLIRYQDEYTKLHTLRVGLLAEMLAPLVYGQPPTEEFRLGVQMHDLGKVGIPQEILQAPRRLSDEEIAVMQRHPTIGADLLSAFETDGVMVEAARSHHERWDGGGYPQGLAGTDIPLAARIISVADTFDAMTSSRPYRTALSIDSALKEIEAGAGTQFDPDIARAFLTLPRGGLEDAVHAELSKAWHTVWETS